MKIGIDARCLQDRQKTGVAEYTLGVLNHLFINQPQDQFVLFLNSFHKIDFDFEWFKQFSNVSIQKFSFPNKLLSFFFYFLNWPKVDKMIGGVDVFFMPNLSLIALSKKCKKILTVHDLSFERFPETFSFKRRMWHLAVNPRRLCQRVDEIWAVSDSTKQDLESLYQVGSSKIKKNFPPFDFKIFSQKNFSEQTIDFVKKKYGIEEDFILFVGTIEPRKNIGALIDAFNFLKEKNKNRTENLKLVIAGGNGWLFEEDLRKIENSHFRKDIILTGFVEKKDKPIFYHLAKIFVYPSIFEGFGYPPIEAMASGCPTITSHCSSIPEVVQDGAVLIDPYRPYELVLAMENLLFDEKLFRYYAEKGREQAKKISQEKKDWKIA